MKYLVTGSSGFIGSHLSLWLTSNGHEVVHFDLKDDSGDIRNAEQVLNKAENVNGIFHLAAIASVQETIEDPARTYENNVIGTRHVLEAALKYSIPIVYASSAAIYGDNQNLPLSESETPSPLSPYAEHKLQNEIDAKQMGEKGLESFGVRFFNIYGPGQDPQSPYSGVISIFYDHLRQTKPITIYGDGAHSRDFVYVGDAVKALVAGIDHAHINAPVVNVCTGISNTLLDLANTLGQAFDHAPDIHFKTARKGDIVHSLGDPSYMQKAIGFRPEINLLEGISRLVRAGS